MSTIEQIERAMSKLHHEAGRQGTTPQEATELTLIFAITEVALQAAKVEFELRQLRATIKSEATAICHEGYHATDRLSDHITEATRNAAATIATAIAEGRAR